MRAQLQEQATRIELSGIELGCLQRLADGSNTREIATAFKLSDVTIGVVLESATAKLNSKTLFQALVKAARLGLIV